GRDRVRPGRLEGGVEGVQGGASRRVEPPRAWRDVQVACEVRTERPPQPRPAGEGEGLHGGTVIGLGGGDHLPALGLAALDVVAAGELDRQLVRVGPAYGEANPREAGRGDRDELA